MSGDPNQFPEFTTASSDAGRADPNFDNVARMLLETKPWVRFMSVMSFIGSALMVLGGVIIMVGGAAGFGPLAGFGVILGAVYVLMALIYFVPALFLWTYANEIAAFARRRTTLNLVSALGAQKSFWKFVGIFTLVILMIYVAIFAFAIISAVVGAM